MEKHIYIEQKKFHVVRLKENLQNLLKICHKKVIGISLF
jgi:hypothetical protein